jgi:hypothetical protein
MNFSVMSPLKANNEVQSPGKQNLNYMFGSEQGIYLFPTE